MNGKEAASSIRKHELSCQTSVLPDVAAHGYQVDGRMPIIAVSATLAESTRNELSRDFDGWMLKPIDFKRMLKILSGISDESSRREERYVRGHWERGGWFSGAFSS